MTDDWTTTDGLREIARRRASAISGWHAPVAFAVGYRSDGEWEFPHINPPGSTSALSAVMLAEATGYTSGTREIPITTRQLADAVARLRPAEAIRELQHPNLAAWREIVRRAPADIMVVFIASLDDAVAGPADAQLRGRF